MRVITPSWAMWRRRSVGSRTAPTVSQMSWPCAQTSIRRAVRNDLAPIEGPYHSTRLSSPRVRPAASSARRRWRHSVSCSMAPSWRKTPSVASSTASVVGELTDELVAVRDECVRVADRKGGRRVEVGEVTDLVGDRPARRWRGQFPLLRCERGDDGVERLLLGHQIVEYGVDVHRGRPYQPAPPGDDRNARPGMSRSCFRIVSVGRHDDVPNRLSGHSDTPGESSHPPPARRFARELTRAAETIRQGARSGR